MYIFGVGAIAVGAGGIYLELEEFQLV